MWISGGGLGTGAAAWTIKRLLARKNQARGGTALGTYHALRYMGASKEEARETAWKIIAKRNGVTMPGEEPAPTPPSDDDEPRASPSG